MIADAVAVAIVLVTTLFAAPWPPAGTKKRGSRRVGVFPQVNLEARNRAGQSGPAR